MHLCNGFLKRCISVSHSIGTGRSHSGRVKGFERCFEVVNYRLKLSRRQHDHRPAILQLPGTQNKLWEPYLGNTTFLRGINEPHLGNEKPVTGIVQRHLGDYKAHWGIKYVLFTKWIWRKIHVFHHYWKHLSLDRHFPLTIRNLPGNQLLSIIKYNQPS